MTTVKKDSNLTSWNFNIPLDNIVVKVLDLNEAQSYSVIEIKNLPNGFGTVLGSTLHLMHSYSPGVSPISYRLEGITSRVGVSERYNEMAKEISGNIRRAKIKVLEATNEPIVLRCNPNKQYNPGDKILFGDFDIDPVYGDSVCEILNPDLVLATSSIDQMVDFTITFIMGSGYLDEDTDPTDKSLNEFILERNEIRVDCSFSSVKRYNFEVIPDIVSQTDTLLITIEMDNNSPVSLAIDSVFEVILSILQETFTKLKESLSSISVTEIKTDIKDEKIEKLNTFLENCFIENLVLNFQEHNELKEMGYNSLRDLLQDRDVKEKYKSKIRRQIASQLESVGLMVEEEEEIL